ncbi:hypothetical protein MEQU1_000903 [Malassezia equina]|uniref:ML-like domain-containing protein n=1 Tax=Malassezia equina TaxID=1381935 RepID=A0AAF0IZ87_9BASI|nr:hypothetical protein MEQU1_000903 [Malassezia equina]
MAQAATSIDTTNRTLFSRNTAYCAVPGPVYVSALNLKYDGNKEEFSFSVEVASTESKANLDVSLTLYVYGQNFVEMNINLCSLLNGALCPIPSYNFTGSGTVPVPSSFSSKVPEIAFIVPDIDALAVLELSDHTTHAQMGCAQLSLVNSRTVELTEMAWGTGAFAIAAAIASGLTTAWTDSLSALQWRVVDVVTTMQNVAWVSMLTIIVPRVVHAFSLCFGWVVGLLKIEPIQTSIHNTRLATGSNDVQLMFGGLMEAEYSRFANYYPAEVLNSNQSAKLGTVNGLPHLGGMLSKRQLYAPNTGPGGEREPGATGADVVWALPMDAFTQAGAFFYLESMPISPYGAFLTVAVSWLLVLAVVLGCGLLLIPLSVYRYGAPFPAAVRHGYLTWLRPMLLRVLECASPPLVTFALFQWVHGDGWVPHLAAALMCAALLFFWVTLWLQQREQVRLHGSYALSYKKTSPYRGDSAAIHYGSISHPYRPRYWWFWTVMLLCAFLRACFVAIPQKNDYGMRQSVGLLAVDVLLLVALLVCRPGCDKKGNMVMIVMALFRIVTWALCVVLTTTMNIWGIPRAVLGLVVLAVLALAILFLFFVFVWDIATALLSPRQRWSKRYAEKEDEDMAADTASPPAEHKEVTSGAATTP